MAYLLLQQPIKKIVTLPKKKEVMVFYSGNNLNNMYPKAPYFQCKIYTNNSLFLENFSKKNLEAELVCLFFQF